MELEGEMRKNFASDMKIHDVSISSNEGQGKARQGKARQGKARQDRAGHGEARQGNLHCISPHHDRIRVIVQQREDHLRHHGATVDVAPQGGGAHRTVLGERPVEDGTHALVVAHVEGVREGLGKGEEVGERPRDGVGVVRREGDGEVEREGGEGRVGCEVVGRGRKSAEGCSVRRGLLLR